MSSTSDKTPALKDNMVFRAIDDKEACLLDIDNKHFFALNPTALFILEQLKLGQNKAAIAKAMSDAFNVDEETCQRDLESFLKELSEQDLIGR